MAMDPALLDSSTLAGTNSSQDSLATTSLGEGIDDEEAILAELVETAILAGFESTSNCSSGQVRKGSLDQCAINCEPKSSGCSSSRSIRVDDQRNAAFGLDSGRKMLRNQTSCVFPRRGCAVRPWKGPLPKKKNLPKIKLDAFMPENFKSSSVRVETVQPNPLHALHAFPPGDYTSSSARVETVQPDSLHVWSLHRELDVAEKRRLHLHLVRQARAYSLARTGFFRNRS